MNAKILLLLGVGVFALSRIKSPTSSVGDTTSPTLITPTLKPSLDTQDIEKPGFEGYTTTNVYNRLSELLPALKSNLYKGAGYESTLKLVNLGELSPVSAISTGTMAGLNLRNELTFLQGQDPDSFTKFGSDYKWWA